MDEPVILKLSRPVTVMGNEVPTLTIRPPVGRDLMATGDPMQITGSSPESMSMVTNARIMGALIARLANVPLTTVEDLCAADFGSASRVVLGFLAPTEG